MNLQISSSEHRWVAWHVSWTLLAGAFIYLFSHAAVAQSFAAYSLAVSQRRLQAQEIDDDLLRLGGITRFAAVVHDRRSNDVILVGQMQPEDEPVGIDDLVVAMRAILVHKTPPLVSIDRTAETPITQSQTIRFEGGIRRTSFGRALLAADILLKKIALGLVPGKSFGITSYFDLVRGGSEQRDVHSLFWFVFEKGLVLAVRPGVVALADLGMRVKTVVTAVAPKRRHRDPAGDQFAQAITDHFWLLAKQRPELNRLKQMFDLAALASGISYLPSEVDLDFLLRAYSPAAVDTPDEYPLLNRRATNDANGKQWVVEMDGGVRFRALISRLADGDAEALRDIVLESRNDQSALSWRVPLEPWQVPGWPSEAPDRASATKLDTELGVLKERIGVSIRSRSYSTESGQPAFGQFSPFVPKVAPIVPTIVGQLPALGGRATDKLGGVSVDSNPVEVEGKSVKDIRRRILSGKPNDGAPVWNIKP